ncbi:MAG: NHL repeat-containing protein [Thermomicrobiales bacterium]
MRRRAVVMFIVGPACLFLLGSVLQVGALAPGNEHFQRTWARTDQPVAAGQVSRTWMWGPDGFTGEISETYSESPGGQRTVQYFDKARMEITNPSGDSGSAWYVTNGLLVVELISGRLQAGDSTFESRTPAAVNVAGDADDPAGPTYATFGNLLGASPAAAGVTLTMRLSRSGQVTPDPELAEQGLTVARIDDVTNHSIASPFWDFMTSSGTIWDGTSYVQAPLFENAYFATGRPITEPYWANVKVAGTYQDVLMQCFERRCLTYNPANAPEWRVEAGNVGRHYYDWRYAQPAGTATATTTAPAMPTATSTIAPSPSVTPTTSPIASPSASPTTIPPQKYEYSHSWGGEFVPIASRLNLVSDVAADPDGDVWVVDPNLNRLLEFDSQGRYKRQIGPETVAFKSPFAMEFDAAGNLYVADSFNNRIVKLSPGGEVTGGWGTLGSGPGQLNNPQGIAIRGTTVYVADTSNYRIQVFDLDGNVITGWGSQGSAAGQFNSTSGVAVDSAGNIYVADSGNHRVQVFTSAGGYLRQFGSEGSGNGQFKFAEDVAISDDDTVYVTDWNNNRVQIFGSGGVYRGQWGRDGTGRGEFANPWGIAIDAAGNIYVADNLNYRAQKFTANGEYLFEMRDNRRGLFGIPGDVTVGLNGSILVADGLPGYERVQIYLPDGTPLEDFRPAANAPNLFGFVASVAAASDGSYYVVDTGHSRIQHYSSSWQYLGQWGTPGSGPGQFDSPQGIAFDQDGDIYVVDQGNNRVQKFDSSGGFISAWGSLGSAGGQFDAPIDIAIRGETVYVTDTNNNRVQMFGRDGSYLGEWGEQGAEPGQFDRPIGVAVDTAGDVFVVDHGNGRVQKFDGEGMFLSAWGSPGSQPGQLEVPWGIAVDSNGDVYVTEQGSFRVQVFRPST